MKTLLLGFALLVSFGMAADSLDCRIVGALALPLHPLNMGSIGADDTLACVALGESGLAVVNIADPENPALLGRWKHATGNSVNAVAVSGKRAYLASNYGFRVINLDDPTNPTQLRAHPTGACFGVVVRDHYAYVATWTNGLTIYDLNDSLNPSYLSRVKTDSARTITLRGKYAFIADQGDMEIVDIANPAHPVRKGSLASGYYCEGVAAWSHYAIMADGLSLQTVDVRNVNHPVQIGYYDQPGYAYDVQVFCNPDADGVHYYARVAVSRNGYQVFDVTDPTNLQMVGYYDPQLGSGAGWKALARIGNYDYADDDLYGLKVVEFTGLGTPLPLGPPAIAHGPAVEVPPEPPLDYPGAFALATPANNAVNQLIVDTLRWHASVDADSYDVYWGTGNPPAFVESTTDTFAAYSGATSQTYYWYVSAGNAEGSTESDNQFRFSTVPTAPGAFALTAPANESVDAPVSGAMAWGASQYASTYDVYWGTDSPPVTRQRSGLTSPSCSYSGLADTTTYYWRVKALNVTDSAWCNAVFSFITPTPPPPPPPPSDTVGQWFVATTGSDDSAGTSIDKAFLTIQKGIDSAQAGDTVMVLRGTYPEQLTFPRSGTAEAPIVLRGEVDEAGHPLVTIDPTVAAPTVWVAAPEVGDGVWKQGGFTPYLMTYNDQQLLRIYDQTMAGLEDVGMGMVANGKEILRWPEDTTWNVHGIGTYAPFWKLLTAIYGVVGDTCYLRFADGRDPDTCDLRASETDNTRAITLHNDWITLEYLKIQGATVGIRMAQSDNNIVQDCQIIHGNHAVLCETTSAYNIFRRNNFSPGAISSMTFGAWGVRTVEAYLEYEESYVFYKYLEGNSTSRSTLMRFLLAGDSNQVYDNTLANGSVAIWHCGGNYLSIHDNSVTNFSSIGFEIDRNAKDFYCYDNDASNINNICRFMDMGGNTTADTVRSGWIYGNRFSNPARVGAMIYDLYTANPRYYPRLIFYHNSYHGGSNTLEWMTDTVRTPPSGLWAINNIFSSRSLIASTRYFDDTSHVAWEAFDYNFCGGLYKAGRPFYWMWEGDGNAMSTDSVVGDTLHQMWPLLGGTPDWLVSDTSEAYETGYDLSQDTIWMRDTFLLGPLPGCDSGYFGAKPAPNMGASQE